MPPHAERERWTQTGGCTRYPKRPPPAKRRWQKEHHVRDGEQRVTIPLPRTLPSPIPRLSYLCRNVSTGKAIETAARRIALLILRGIAGRRQGLPLLRDRDLRRVLLIRFDRIGDAVITTPLIAALKQAAPAVEIESTT